MKDTQRVFTLCVKLFTPIVMIFDIHLFSGKWATTMGYFSLRVQPWQNIFFFTKSVFSISQLNDP